MTTETTTARGRLAEARDAHRRAQGAEREALLRFQDLRERPPGLERERARLLAERDQADTAEALAALRAQIEHIETERAQLGGVVEDAEQLYTRRAREALAAQHAVEETEAQIAWLQREAIPSAGRVIAERRSVLEEKRREVQAVEEGLQQAERDLVGFQRRLAALLGA